MQPKMVSVNALNRTHYREMYIASAVWKINIRWRGV
jgi:hypothetical protein